MVTITNYQVKKNQRNESFIILNLISDVVMEKSVTTGNWFANTYKANIVASFDEESAKHMLGQRLPGQILKVKCKPYVHTIRSTGKQVELNYTFEYCESGDTVVKSDVVQNDVQAQ